MEESNKLIAEFMGYTHQSDSAFKDENGFWNDFEVFETWDWLMPVVEKIDEVSDENTLFKVEHNRAFIEDIENYHIFIDVIASSRLEATYKAVVEFIKNQKT
jgi:hypothetical protein